jgi:hypothetical protein
MVDIWNASDALNTTIGKFAPFLLSPLSPVISLLKIAGVVFIVYLFFNILQFILKFKDSKRIKRMEEKIDLLLEKSSIKYQNNKKKK